MHNNGVKIKRKQIVLAYNQVVTTCRSSKDQAPRRKNWIIQHVCVPLADVMMGTTLVLHVGDYEPTTSFFICDRSSLFDNNSFKAQNTVLYKVAPKITYLHTEFHIFLIINKYIPPLEMNYTCNNSGLLMIFKDGSSTQV